MTGLQISKRGALELLSHEGAVLEAYKDSVGVWTWGIGITDNSGHAVQRYRNNPQTLQRVLEVYLWALKRYETDVIAAFAPIKLNEHQLAAATSFHYNTGGIKRASWVKKFKAGDIAGAKRAFMSWKKPKEIIPRRRTERDLFFDEKWTGKSSIVIWGVYKNGNVNWSSRKSVDAKVALNAAWGDVPLKKIAPKSEPIKADKPDPKKVEQALREDGSRTIQGADIVKKMGGIESLVLGVTGAAGAIGKLLEQVSDNALLMLALGVIVGVLGLNWYQRKAAQKVIAARVDDAVTGKNTARLDALERAGVSDVS